jgi:hypothetical protein
MNMKSYLRENPTIAFGLGLPLLLVVVFLVISGVPSLLIKAPQYDVVYATQYSSYGNSVRVSVVGQKAQVTYQGDGYESNQELRLWRYNSKTGAVREIFMLLPASRAQTGHGSIDSEEIKPVIVIDVPDLDGLTINSSSIAPDGYEFDGGSNRYSSNFFGSMLFSSRHGYEAALTKQGRTIRLPNSNGRYYSHDTQFIGWVVVQ